MRAMLAGAVVAAALVATAMTPAAHGVARLAVRLAAAMKSVPKTASPTAMTMPVGHPFAGTSAVGALFSETAAGQLGTHFCTASVVDSPHADHHRVVVRADDVRARRHTLRDLVHVPLAGQPGADVDELADPRLGGQVVDHPAEERPVLPGERAQIRDGDEQFLCRLPVGRVVVLPAEQVVVDAGRAGHLGVERQFSFAASTHHRTSVDTTVPGLSAHGIVAGVRGTRELPATADRN